MSTVRWRNLVEQRAGEPNLFAFYLVSNSLVFQSCSSPGMLLVEFYKLFSACVFLHEVH
jgi:hypothetical protein